MKTQLLNIPALQKSTIKRAAAPEPALCCSQPSSGSACCSPSAAPEDNGGACCAQPTDGSACCDK